MLMLNPVDSLPEKLLGYDSFFSHFIATSTSHESVASQFFCGFWPSHRFPDCPCVEIPGLAMVVLAHHSPHRPPPGDQPPVLCVRVEFAAHRDFILLPFWDPPKQRWNSWECHMGMDQYLLIPFLGGWTSINPSYFDVNYRGTRFWHTVIFLDTIWNS